MDNVLIRYGLTYERLCDVIGFQIEHAPPYFELGVRAIVAGRKPARRDRFRERAHMLPVDNAVVNYWLNTGQYPLLARYAVSGLTLPTGVTQHWRRALRNINTGRYYRAPKGYRALPVMGRPLPLITLDLARKLRDAGFVTISGTRLRITHKGKNVATD